MFAYYYDTIMKGVIIMKKGGYLENPCQLMVCVGPGQDGALLFSPQSQSMTSESDVQRSLLQPSGRAIFSCMQGFDIDMIRYSQAANKETRHIFSGGLRFFNFPYENIWFSHHRNEKSMKMYGFQSLRFLLAFLSSVAIL